MMRCPQTSRMGSGRPLVVRVAQSAPSSQLRASGKRSHAVGLAGVKRSGTKKVLSWSSRPVKKARKTPAPPRRTIQTGPPRRTIQPVVVDPSTFTSFQYAWSSRHAAPVVQPASAHHVVRLDNGEHAIIIQPVTGLLQQKLARTYDHRFNDERFVKTGLSPFGWVKHPDYISQYPLCAVFTRADYFTRVCVKLPAITKNGIRTPSAFYIGVIRTLCHSKSKYIVRTPSPNPTGFAHLFVARRVWCACGVRAVCVRGVCGLCGEQTRADGTIPLEQGEPDLWDYTGEHRSQYALIQFGCGAIHKIKCNIVYSWSGPMPLSLQWASGGPP
jgi:hypothetical protein